MTTTHAEYDDDFETEILPIRRRPRLPLLTAVLALAVIAAAAFAGGVEIQKHYGGSSSAAASGTGGAGAAGFARARRAGAGGFAGGGTFGGDGGATVGLVTLIKGTTLYVTDFSGNTVKVATTGAQVSKTLATTLRGVHPGGERGIEDTSEQRPDELLLVIKRDQNRKSRHRGRTVMIPCLSAKGRAVRSRDLSLDRQGVDF